MAQYQPTVLDTFPGRTTDGPDEAEQQLLYFQATKEAIAQEHGFADCDTFRECVMFCGWCAQGHRHELAGLEPPGRN
ncbi:hypothetical protein GCM10027073_34710 [Streptomyces chlorus]